MDGKCPHNTLANPKVVHEIEGKETAKLPEKVTSSYITDDVRKENSCESDESKYLA